jgi:hypothetical protein
MVDVAANREARAFKTIEQITRSGRFQSKVSRLLGKQAP